MENRRRTIRDMSYDEINSMIVYLRIELENFREKSEAYENAYKRYKEGYNLYEREFAIMGKVVMDNGLRNEYIKNSPWAQEEFGFQNDD